MRQTTGDPKVAAAMSEMRGEFRGLIRGRVSDGRS